MVRLLWAFLLAVMATASIAAFDLQFVKKYNPSVVAESGFNLVERDGQGGFFALGKAGLDVLLVRFDQHGSITHTRVWDTPDVDSESIHRLDVTTGRDVAIVVETQSSGYMVRFDENLIFKWYRQIPKDAMAATNSGGVGCYVTAASGGSATAQIVATSGALSGSVNITSDSVVAVEPCDSSVNPGFLIAGNRSNQAYIARITNSAGGIYNTTTPASASGTNSAKKLDSDTSGVVSAIGQLYDGSYVRPALFRVSSSGTITTSLLPAGTQLSVKKLTIYSSTLARALYRVNSIDRLIEFNRTSFAVTRTYVDDDIRDFAHLVDGNQMVVPTTGNNLLTFDVTTGTNTNYSAWETVATAPVANNLVVSVGKVDDRATVVWKTPTDHFDNKFAFPGPVERTVIDTDLGSSGVIAFGGAYSGVTFSEGYVTAYRSDGTLAFAKSFFPGTIAAVDRVLVLSDGSVLAAGRIQGSTQIMVAATLYSPSGVVTFAKTYPLANITEARALAHSPGAGYFLIGPSTTGSSSLVRVGGNGLLFWTKEVIAGPSTSSNMVVTAAGDLAIVLRRNTGANAYIVSAGSGDVLQTATMDGGLTWANAEVDLAPNGDVVALVTRQDQTIMRRYNSATLAELDSYSDTARTLAFDIGTNGRVALLQAVGMQFHIRQLPADWNVAVTTNLESSVDILHAVAVGPTGLVYVLGEEFENSNYNTYSAKYLTNGVRSAVRRLSGRASEIYAPTGAVWITGVTPTRAKGIGPYAARYTP